MIYIDNHLLIMNKPAGLATQPSKDNAKNLLDAAKCFLKKKYKKAGAVFLEPIHRLDKPVSGLVVFARTSKALSRLQEAMRAHQIERIYQALVEKAAPGGILEHYLVHDEHKARVVPSTHPEGKKAILYYTYLGPVEKGHLLEMRLETGRYHQIRAQLCASRFPIIGDEKYGSKIPFKKGEIALHHAQVSFCHPVTKELKTFTASRPASWHC